MSDKVDEIHESPALIIRWAASEWLKAHPDAALAKSLQDALRETRLTDLKLLQNLDELSSLRKKVAELEGKLEDRQ